jgi:DNA-binding GntR family transcriptional regulator
MEIVAVDTRRAYEQIREKITSLNLAPGAMINEQRLAESLDMGMTPVREALKLLVHDDLVVITPRHGLYVADINLPDLEQLSEVRLSLESLCARLAALRADADDIRVLEALRQEQATIVPADGHLLFDLDHRFHQALVGAAKNKYLARTLEHLFGLSQRLWNMALPRLDFLSSSVADHLKLIEAVKAKEAERAERIMYNHVRQFYDKMREVLATSKK